MVANSMISKFLAPVTEGLSDATARELLAMGFSRAEKSRMRALADKSNEGTLNSEEHLELEDWCVAGDLLALLQAEARIARKQRRRGAVHASRS